jgi:hypothetical protein
MRRDESGHRPDGLETLAGDERVASRLLSTLGDRQDPRDPPPSGLDAVLARVAARDGFRPIELPRLELVLPRAATIEELTAEWPEVPDELFPRWKATDVAAVFVAGLAGAFTSGALEERYDELHEGTFSKQHAGETIDRVPGQMAGGFLHRLKHGHDVLLPLEVDWPRYAPDKGLDSFGKAFWPWLRHLLQDTFSREGLPGPGTGYFRDVIVEHATREEYQELWTLKARDVSGTALTAALIRVYSHGSSLVTEGRMEASRGYRHATLAFAAHMISAITGLLLPRPSLNGSALLCAAKAGLQIVRVARYVDGILADGDGRLANRAATLAGNEVEIQRVGAHLASEGARLADFGARLAAAQRRMHAVPFDLARIERLLDADAAVGRRLLATF